MTFEIPLTKANGTKTKIVVVAKDAQDAFSKAKAKAAPGETLDNRTTEWTARDTDGTPVKYFPGSERGIVNAQSANPIVRKAINSCVSNAGDNDAFIKKWQPVIRDVWRKMVSFDLEMPSDMRMGPQWDVACKIVKAAHDWLTAETWKK